MTDSRADIEIQFSPNGRMTEKDQATLSDLVRCMRETGLTVDHRIAFRRSLELPVVVSIVVGNLLAALKLFGVTDYFKTRFTERAKYDSALANKRRIARTTIVEKLSNLRNYNVVVLIELGVPSPFNHSGGLSISGKSSDEIASQIEVLLFHSQALIKLINSEIIPSGILGGVYLKPLPNGDLEVKWMLRDEGRTVIEILSRSSSSNED